MSDIEQLRAWCAKTEHKLHERVLPDGRHHVWLSVFPGCRVDRAHRDFAFACRLVWGWLLTTGFAKVEGDER